MYTRPGRQIALLIIVNLILLALIPVSLHLMGVVDLTPYYKWIPYIGEEEEQVAQRIEPESLLREEQLRKWEERLALWEATLEEQSQELLSQRQELESAIADFEDEKEALGEQVSQHEQRVQRYDDRQQNIQTVANMFQNMNPDQAVLIIAGLDNQDVVDIFREMNRQAAETGQTSLVPYYNMLLAGAKDIQLEDEEAIENLQKSREIIRLMLKYPTEDLLAVEEDIPETQITEEATGGTSLLEELGLPSQQSLPSPQSLPETQFQPME